MTHSKLIEVVQNSFLNFSNIIEYFKNQDVCIYCLGVYTGQVPNNEFTKITVDFTKVFAEALKVNNEKITFCFLSGQGTVQIKQKKAECYLQEIKEKRKIYY